MNTGSFSSIRWFLFMTSVILVVTIKVDGNLSQDLEALREHFCEGDAKVEGEVCNWKEDACKGGLRCCHSRGGFRCWECCNSAECPGSKTCW